MGDRLSRKVVCLVKKEVTYGVDPTPVGSDAVLLEDPTIRAVGEKLERRSLRDTLSMIQHVIGIKHWELTFTVELKGSGAGATPPEIGPLIQCCNFSETIDSSNNKVTYDLQSITNGASCTLYFYQDGLLHKFTGCRGSLEVNAEAGEYGKITFTIWGVYNSPTDAAAPTPTFDTTLVQMIKSTGFTWGGFAASVTRTLQFNLNNDLVLVRDLRAAEALKSIKITGRSPSGSFDPEAELEATEPFFADWEAGTVHSWTIQIGAAAGNTVTITGNGEYESVDPGDRDGILIYEIPFAMPSTTFNTTDDEVKFEFS